MFFCHWQTQPSSLKEMVMGEVILHSEEYYLLSYLVVTQPTFLPVSKIHHIIPLILLRWKGPICTFGQIIYSIFSHELETN